MPYPTSSEADRAVTRRSRVARPFATTLLAFSLFTFLAVERVHAQGQSAVTTRLSVFTGAGFGGEATITYDGSLFAWSGSADLEATPLAGARYEKAFLRYLAFGGQLRAGFWRPEGSGNRHPLLDLSMTPRIRYPIVVDGRFMIEPYLVVPIGLSIAIWNAADAPSGSSGLDRANPGLNVGALLGVTFLSRSGVGAMLEFGWLHHVAYDRDEADDRFSLLLNQATLQTGVVYAF